MSRPITAAAALRLTVIISVESDDLLAHTDSAEVLEADVARLLELYPDARVSVARELVSGARSAEFSKRE